MIKFRLANGTYKNVKPEHLDIFKERHPDAVEIGTATSDLNIPVSKSPSGYDLEPFKHGHGYGEFSEWNLVKFFKEISKPEEEKAIKKVEKTDRKKPSYFAAKSILAP